MLFLFHKILTKLKWHKLIILEFKLARLYLLYKTVVIIVTLELVGEFVAENQR